MNKVVSINDESIFPAQSALGNLHHCWLADQISIKYNSTTPEINAPSGRIIILWLEDPSALPPTSFDAINTAGHKVITTSFKDSAILRLPPSKKLYTGSASDGSQAPGNKYHGRLCVYTDLSAVQTNLGELEIESLIRFRDFTRNSASSQTNSSFNILRTGCHLTKVNGSGLYDAKPTADQFRGTIQIEEREGVFADSGMEYQAMNDRVVDGWVFNINNGLFQEGDVILLTFLWSSNATGNPFSTLANESANSLDSSLTVTGNWELFYTDQGERAFKNGHICMCGEDSFSSALTTGASNEVGIHMVLMRVTGVNGASTVAVPASVVTKNSGYTDNMRTYCSASVVGNVTDSSEVNIDQLVQRKVAEAMAKMTL